MKYLMLIFILMAVPIQAEEYAVTDNGKTVLLKDDGRWEYTEEGAKIAAEERKQFWIDIAVNIAKVLGIIAALITLRFVIQAVGKGLGAEGDQSEKKEDKKTEV